MAIVRIYVMACCAAVSEAVDGIHYGLCLAIGDDLVHWQRQLLAVYLFCDGERQLWSVPRCCGIAALPVWRYGVVDEGLHAAVR